MASCGKEFLSLFFYKICNPKRSDEEHVEEVEEMKAEGERKRFDTELERLKTLFKKVEAERKRFEAENKRFEAENKRLRRILENNSEEKKAEFCLPSDLLVVILSRLALKDNIRSSAVCKRWGEIAASVRVRDRTCWLMYLVPCRISGFSYGFFDPVEKKKTKAMNLPELPKSKSLRILCSNDGWLLMGDYVDLFFFNPFTRECINLPRINIMQMQFAFSCAPTKKGCLVFGITSGGSSQSVKISTWHPGATTWVNEVFPNQFPGNLIYSDARNVVYSDDGLFYMSLGIALIGVFDPSARTWNVVPVQPIPSPMMQTIRWMTQYKGQIFLVDASSQNLVVFRLNRLEWVWEKKETLDGSSIFVSNASSVMTCGLTGSMSNIVYVWDSSVINGRRPTKYQCRFKWNRPYKYSLYKRGLCEDPDGYYFEYRIKNGMDGVWIEPPHNISITDFSILPADAINMRLFI